MSPSTPDAPRRAFGAIDDSALDDNDGMSTNERRGLGFGRVSFSQGQRKPSFISRWRRTPDEEEGMGRPPSTITPERPLIPSALEQKGEAYTTPLPTLSMIVLSIVRFLLSPIYSLLIIDDIGDVGRVFIGECFHSIHALHGQRYVIMYLPLEFELIFDL